jgi:hypothetical protein
MIRQEYNAFVLSQTISKNDSRWLLIVLPNLTKSNAVANADVHCINITRTSAF